ncbi:MAG: protein kinase [Myxococcota bacterium]
MVGWLRWLMVIAMPWLLFACTSGDERRIDRWTLHADEHGAPVEIELPQHVDEYLPDADTRYRLVADVELGSLAGTELSLVIPHFEGIAELHVDGRDAVATHLGPGDRYRHAGPHVWRLPAVSEQADHVTLELLVEHRWSQSAWLDTVPRLRPADDLGPAALTVLVLNHVGAIAAACGLVLIGLMSMGLHLANPSRRSYLWFSIQMLCAAWYPIHVSGYAQLLVGRYETVLMMLALELAVFAALEYSVAEFGRGRPHHTRWWAIGIGIAALITLGSADPYSVTEVGGRAAVAAIAAVTTFLIFLGIAALSDENPPRGSVNFLIEWCVLGAAIVLDSIPWLGLGEPLGGARAACLGLGTFALFNSLRLTREHIHSLGTTDRLNRQLERRVTALEAQRNEVERLHEQLRDQLGHRSRQLFSMLSMVGRDAEPTPVLNPGDSVGGKYRVMHQLGKGGMGVVYAVLRQADEQRLALKIAVHADAWGLARLAREAEIATRVDHPNVVTVTDVDIDPRGFLYMVMEHVDGSTLAEYKPGFGRDQRWAMDVLRQVAEGLAALHEEGVVHRDLKPGNILLLMRLDGELQVKITDFGISRTLDADMAGPLDPQDSTVHMPIQPAPDTLEPAARRLLDAQIRGEAAEQAQAHVEQAQTSVDPPTVPGIKPPATPAELAEENTRPLRVDEVRNLELWERSSPITEAGTIIGTPVYMAPELAEDPPIISPAADIFSFGVLAHMLLTGARPFSEPPVMEVADGRPLPPRLDLDLSRIPEALHGIMRSCLSFKTDERPTAARLAMAFAEQRRALGEPPATMARNELEATGEHTLDVPVRRRHERSPPEPHAA